MDGEQSLDVDCTNTPMDNAAQSNLSCHTDVSIIDENGDEYVHRLVQDENAKTILLNVPLENNSSSLGTGQCTNINMDCAASTTSSCSSTGSSTLKCSSFITTGISAKPPRRPGPSSSSRSLTSGGGSILNSETPNNRQNRKKNRVGGAEIIDMVLASKISKNKSRASSTSSSSTTVSSRVRSASVGRDKRSDLQARYWAFLFENVRRAVDDLYTTCESDESIPATKEVILVFENYVRDFRNLANWLKLKWEYENTPLPQRPTSLAWEVRKTPPASAAKLTPTSLLATQRLLMATPAKRALDFDAAQSSRSNKKSHGNNNAPSDTMDDMKVCETTQNLLKLGKTISDGSVTTYVNSDFTVKKIKEFTPVKEDEELCNGESENKDNLHCAFNNYNCHAEALNSKEWKEDQSTSKNPSQAEAQLIGETAALNSELLVSNDVENQSKDLPEDVATTSISDISKSNDYFTVQKQKSDSNLGTKTVSNSKLGSNASLSKGYSAVTRASVNRAKISMTISNTSNNVSSTGSCHGRSSNGARTSNLNLSKTSNQNGKTSTANQAVIDKIMTSSTTSSTGGLDTSTTTSQSSSTSADKSVSSSVSTKLSATNTSTTSKKTSIKPITNTSGATIANTTCTGITGESSPKTQRLSLVQRQARFAASALTTTNTGRASFTRSATTPSFSSRGRSAAGNANRPQTAKPLTSRFTTANRIMSTSSRNHLPLKASNSTPVASEANHRITSTSNCNPSVFHPFGSTSSISSSGSSRSWADTVKGLRTTSNVPMAAKSVENLSVNISPHEQDKSNKGDEDKNSLATQDEGGEWETVKPRTRSRISPINSQLAKSRTTSTHSLKGDNLFKRSSSFNGNVEETSKKDFKGSRSNNISTIKKINKSSKQYSKDRFLIPSSATSMPSLTIIDKNDKNKIVSTKTEQQPNKTRIDRKPGISPKMAPKGISIKEKLPKGTHHSNSSSDIMESSITKTEIASSSSASSTESLEENTNKKEKSKTNGLATKGRFNNVIGSSTKGKKAKSFKENNISNTELNIRNTKLSSCKDVTDIINNNPIISLNNDSQSEDILPKGSVEHVCSQSSNKENIPFGEVEYDGIGSYPHQLDTCLEDDECEVDAGEAETEADSELDENEAAIALIEEEEESLAREIKETECSQLAEDALDSANECDPDDAEHIVASAEHSIDNKIFDTEEITEDNLDITETGGEDQVKQPYEPSTPSKYEALFDGLSWIEQIELEEQLVEARRPGRAIEIHEKLSSPARKREPQEAFKHQQEKQNNARVRRQMFKDEKAQRLVALNTRIEEVIVHREFLLRQRREMIMKKMAKAEAKRQEHIAGIRKKAGVEETKLKEIAFINELSAQNTRIDMLAQNQAADEKAEERLAEFAGERAKKAEQREAKEARAEERRRKLEAKRINDVEALRIKILRREERIQEEQEQTRKDREEATREKNRDREEKLSTVRAAEKDMKEELQEKIQQKMEDAAKRHQEKLEQVRHKAFELSIKRCSTDEGEMEGGALLHPMLLAYDPKKKCEVCGILIHNEVQLQSHLRGKKHSEKLRNFVLAQNETKSRSRPSSLENSSVEGRKMSGEEVQKYNLRYIVDAPVDEPDPKVLQLKERNKSMKKRARKIKTRMAIRAADYEKMLFQVSSSKISDAPHKAKIGKSLRDIEKLLCSQGKGAWPNNSVSSLERALGEIVRSFQDHKVTGTKESQSNEKWQEKQFILTNQDKQAFYEMDGFTTLSKLFHLLADASPSAGSKQIDQRPVCVIPLKSIVLCCKTWTSAFFGHRNNTEFVLKSNYLSTISDILHHRLHILIPESSLPTSKKNGDLDSIGDQLQWPAPDGPQVDPVAKAIMISLAQCLEDLAVYLTFDHENKQKLSKEKNMGLSTQPKQVLAFDDLALRVHDQVSYMIATGIVDKLAAYFHSVQDPIDDRPEVGEFLLASLDLMSALTVCVEALSIKTTNSASSSEAANKLLCRDLSSSSSVVDGTEGSTSSTTGSVSNDLVSNTNLHISVDSNSSDPTYLLSAFQMTDLAGTISMLYGILLHQGAPPRVTGGCSKEKDNEAVPLKLSSHTLNVVAATARLLHRMVRQHLTAVQEVLGQEGISLEFRHIASYLLWYCQAANNAGNQLSENDKDNAQLRELLHEVIALVGYFAARHQDNQTIVQSGHRPSVLEQLCNLPFPYFSQPELKRILFPTLLACCLEHEENRAILQEEMNWQLIDDFLYSPFENGKNEHLSTLVLCHDKYRSPR